MNCPHCGITTDEGATVCARCGTGLAPALPGEFAPGYLVHARYRIERRLGRGGMGVVYKAHDGALDEVVALKVLRPEFSAESAMAERFKSEIKLARKVRHRNVCSIYDFGEDRGLLYFTMEFIDGVDLKRCVRESGALPSDAAYALAIQIAEGLAAVHEAGIIHRDMKTANVMRDSHGVARLMDFGVAKQPGEGHTLTAIGQIVGTPEYMSPEQAQGKRVDHRTDLYALGIVMYEIFTGSVPFKGDTPISTILKHINEPPPFDGRAAKGIPEGLRSVLQRALAKEPADRYGSANEMAEAIRRSRSPSLRQEKVSTSALEAATAVRGEGRAPWPRGWMVPASGLLLAAIVAFVGLHFRATRETPASPAPPTIPAASAPSTRYASSVPAATSSGTAMPSTTRPTLAATSSVSREPVTTSLPSLATVTAPLPAQVTSSTSSPAVAIDSAPRPEASTRGFLQVGVVPWAEVTVDGTVIGTTPLETLSLPPGRHRIRLRHPSYEVLERELVIRAGETSRVIVNFAKDGVPKPR